MYLRAYITKSTELEMFTKHKVYYTIEAKVDDMFVFVCSFSSFNEAKIKLDELTSTDQDKEYRILRIEKDVEEVQ